MIFSDFGSESLVENTKNNEDPNNTKVVTLLRKSHSDYFLKNHQSFRRVKKLRNGKMRLLHQFNEPAKLFSNKSFKANKFSNAEESKLSSFKVVHDGVAYSISWNNLEINSLESSYSSKDFPNPIREWLPINDPECFNEALHLLKTEISKDKKLSQSEYVKKQLSALKDYFAAQSAK